MPSPRRFTVRAIASLFLAVALVAGLGWNATRLNATERKLVGAWENVTDNNDHDAVIFLADRQKFTLVHSDDGEHPGHEWAYANAAEKWFASQQSISVRQFPAIRPGASLDDWVSYLRQLWPGGDYRESRIDALTDQRLVMDGQAYVRSSDDDLQRIFRRLSGKSP